MRPPLPRCALVLLAACAEPRTWDAPAPSVILISLDTLRAGHTSLYGYERETTPYLDRLAEECLVFDQAHSVAPWTLISHVSMLTGLFPEQHGVVAADLALSPEIPYLAQRLHAAGYQTVGLYRPGFIGPQYGQDRGFDVFREHQSAREAGLHLARALRGLDRGRPLFLFLHLFDVHSDPLHAPTDFFYDTPPPYDRWFLSGARERLHGQGEVFRRLRDRGEGAVPLSTEQIEAMVALYDGKIRYVDAVLERWIETFRREGLLDDALLVVTSDHGESLAQRDGGIQGHGWMWQDALHIPLLARFPDGHRAGERADELVSLVDVVPTVMDVAGLERDPRLPGHSLRGPLPADRVVSAAHPPSYALIRLPWKSVGRRGQAVSVLNLEEDPLELSPARRGEQLFDEVSRSLAEAYERELGSRPAFDAPPVPAAATSAAERDDLHALGYGGDGDS